ncbi:MAG: hypothetical protein HOV86_18710 [Thermoactinospora sp.]|nr:hypothetical protein [Thermoactinospora sp.]
MPRPGSHAYDNERRRLRKQLDNQGLSEQELKKRVSRKLQSDPDKSPRKVGGDRAEGPKSERPRRGER